MAKLAGKILNRVYPPRNMLFYLQRQVLNPTSRRRISRLVASRLERYHQPRIGARSQALTQSLDNDGYAMLPPLVCAAQIAEIFEYIADKPCFDRWKPQNGHFHIAQAPANCHTAPYDQTDLAQCPHLLETANHPLILETVSRLFDCKPTISNMGLWWSLSGHDQPEEAENFHRDVDEWHFIKLFVYLTNVTEDSGPHVFVKGSQREAKLLPISRYTDEQVAEAFGRERIIQFTGAAGTNFLENTFGFHKGQMPRSGRRLLFQAQYSLLPIHHYQYRPEPIAAERAQRFDRYINRLYVARESR
jgi:hypothetical protein